MVVPGVNAESIPVWSILATEFAETARLRTKLWTPPC
jgi:hypothetical protein